MAINLIKGGSAFVAQRVDGKIARACYKRVAVAVARDDELREMKGCGGCWSQR